MWRLYSHSVTMPIIALDVNVAFCEILVPIIRQKITSIGPADVEHVLKRGEGVPENGPF